MPAQQSEELPCYQGGCLCESVRYQIVAELRPVVACHCRQCQKTSGFHVAATSGPKAQLVFLKDQHLTWYASSDKARRGFCKNCGSNLFWHENGSADIAIFAGTLDQPTGLRMVEHVYVQDKGDFYQIDDQLPKRHSFEQSICEK